MAGKRLRARLAIARRLEAGLFSPNGAQFSGDFGGVNGLLTLRLNFIRFFSEYPVPYDREKKMPPEPVETSKAGQIQSPLLPAVIQSADLLHGTKEVFIAHGSELYRLRVTRSGKLILQK
ncbi:MAG: hemin uptake protein HemP [Pirellulales bacterium]